MERNSAVQSESSAWEVNQLFRILTDWKNGHLSPENWESSWMINGRTEKAGRHMDSSSFSSTANGKTEAFQQITAQVGSLQNQGALRPVMTYTSSGRFASGVQETCRVSGCVIQAKLVLHLMPSWIRPFGLCPFRLN
jgi:hypothetical protein